LKYGKTEGEDQFKQVAAGIVSHTDNLWRRTLIASKMYSDPRWSSQKGNAPIYHRETAGQGQRAQFQGVVVPISGSPARNNVAYQTNNHVSAAYAPDNVFQVNSASFPPAQMALSTSISSNGVPSFHKSGIIAHVTAEQQAKPAPPLDYQLLLLSLAEDYFAAAHSVRSLVVSLHQDMEMCRYYKLIATGLGCLEAVLKVSTTDSTVS